MQKESEIPPPTLTIIALAAAAAALGIALLALIHLRGVRRARAETSVPEEARPADATPSAAEAIHERDEILRFIADLHRVESFEQVQNAIARQLPELAGAGQAWVVARIGGRQHVVVPAGASGVAGVFGLEAAQWVTFPLRAGGEAVGVLGVDTTSRPVMPRTTRILRAVAPHIAQALVNADLVDRLRQASILDPLTGCCTRAHGLERLKIELKRAARAGHAVGVLMLDLDNFKTVNDRYGHSAGDAVLTALGATMMRTLRASDVRCRWGGEEFLLVLPETTLEQARHVAESLIRRVADMQVPWKGVTIRVTASVGVTLSRPGESDIEALVARADRALYRAKADGRGCVRIVLGDFTGAPIGGSARTASTLPFRDRRDPGRTDRRQFPGPGRRKSDWDYVGQPFTARSAGDRATPR